MIEQIFAAVVFALLPLVLVSVVVDASRRGVIRELRDTFCAPRGEGSDS